MVANSALIPWNLRFSPLLSRDAIKWSPLEIVVSGARPTSSVLLAVRRQMPPSPMSSPSGSARPMFLVSTFTSGSIVKIPVHARSELEERTVLLDADVAGNWSLGIAFDRRRNRLLVVYADVLGLTYGGVVAYDLRSWERSFLTQLAGQASNSDQVHGKGIGFADGEFLHKLCKAYLCVSGHWIVGCLVAEPIKRAHRVISHPADKYSMTQLKNLIPEDRIKLRVHLLEECLRKRGYTVHRFIKVNLKYRFSKLYYSILINFRINEV
ncbi:hypothetical protein J5N97_002392 [Dioscorea zingiberensis]|uniref:Uncharacterized protein n=1 Tax=Dioscorea zingiberensis TaxID=325984 RepID=A0A9D5D250_9LILI|nr:hypothetical protein J5N97_002392 [Dioscorea zingiberensis]